MSSDGSTGDWKSTPSDMPDQDCRRSSTPGETHLEVQAPSNLDLRTSKNWSGIFLVKRAVQDRPFIETVAKPKLKLGLLPAFLQTTDASGPSWEIEQVLRFCKKTAEVPKARIWIDDRVSTAEKKSVPIWTTSAELATFSRQQVSPYDLAVAYIADL